MNKKPPVSTTSSLCAWKLARIAAALAAACLASATTAQVATEYANQGAAAGAAATGAAKAGSPAVPGKAAPAAKKGAADPKAKAAEAAAPPSPPMCTGDLAAPVAVSVVTGKSTLFKLPKPIVLRSVGDPEVVKARLLSPQMLYLLGGSVGTTNMVLQDVNGVCTIVDVGVSMDPGALQSNFALLLPEEKGIKVTAAADTLVLSGVVSDATKVDQAVQLANAYVRRPLEGGSVAGGSKGGSAGAMGGDGQAGGQGGQLAIGRQNVRVVNLLSVTAPQQVLIEVKVAEVSRKLLDKLGAALHLEKLHGGWAYTLIADFLSGGGGIFDAFKTATGEFITIDGETRPGLVKILAEPNLMAISGQEGSFLAGGKVYFPVAQGSVTSGLLTTGTVPVTLYEQEFGVALKFTPTVLEGGRINLRVAPEVSEISPEGIAIQALSVGGRTIAPVIFTRRASTTVQLYDGQTFAIGGLIKNSTATDIKAFPFLGEIPVLGALFRSTSFQNEKTELLFVVTPHLVKPMAGPVRLPTDAYQEPSRLDLFLGGKLEASPAAAPAPASAPTAPQPAGQPAPRGPSGFETK